ncbi:hypothetical protein M153_13030002932 [Pseudoloma neurophilia]|uniref:Uncharacterized protein n=1 Tax=Pseudoloma neurophilia TaxID=146866 RepID=A0A0R0M2E6_9MICR|nr:hypothetical protein M153_13030002932 [Pseudoloma neurophilia]
MIFEKTKKNLLFTLLEFSFFFGIRKKYMFVLNIIVLILQILAAHDQSVAISTESDYFITDRNLKESKNELNKHFYNPARKIQTYERAARKKFLRDKNFKYLNKTVLSSTTHTVPDGDNDQLLLKKVPYLKYSIISTEIQVPLPQVAQIY